jgi:hypothetical protein
MRRRYETSWTVAAVAGAALAGAAVGGAALVSCIGSNPAAPSPTSEIDGSASPSDGAQPDTAAPGVDSSSEDGGSHLDATSTGDTGTSDTGTPADSGTDGSQTSSDSGTDAADAAPPPCAPGSVTAFVPPPYVHANALSLTPVCSVEDVLGLANSCAVGASTFESCSAYPIEATFWGSSPACVACLTTPEVTLPTPDDAGTTDGGDAATPPPPTYGAAIVTRVTVPNVAGCIEQNDPSDAGLPCAMAVQAAWRCEEFACNPTCPVTDDVSEAAYFACAQAAAATVCKPYADPAVACLVAEADAGATAYAACLQTSATTTGNTTLSGPAAQLFDVAYSFCN